MNSVCQALGLVLTLPVYPFEALLKCSSLGHISVKVFVSITASCVQNRAGPSFFLCTRGSVHGVEDDLDSTLLWKSLEDRKRQFQLLNNLKDSSRFCFHCPEKQPHSSPPFPEYFSRAVQAIPKL